MGDFKESCLGKKKNRTGEKKERKNSRDFGTTDQLLQRFAPGHTQSRTQRPRKIKLWNWFEMFAPVSMP